MSTPEQKPDKTNEINALLKLLAMQQKALDEHTSADWELNQLHRAAVVAAEFLETRSELSLAVDNTKYSLVCAGYTFPEKQPCS